MADVYLHVGLPKTGTTSIQSALERRMEDLAAKGILFPGGWHHAQRLAAYDLLGQRIEGDDSHVVPGAFARLMAEMNAYDGPTIVVSEEALGLARPRHVRRLVEGLRGHRVFVVVGVRDLGRTLVSAWQQEVVMGSTLTWQEFIDAVRDPERGVRAGAAFWIRHDVFRVLDAWCTQVPPELVRVVTVPETAAPTGLLLERFAAATGLPAGFLARGAVRRNQSLGSAELELLRRLNAGIAGPLNKRQYLHVVEQGIRARLSVDGSRLLVPPEEDLAWAREQSRLMVAELEKRPHRVFGDLQDLVPAELAEPRRRLDDVSDTELLSAAEAFLESLALSHGALFRRYRRAFFERHGRRPGPAELLGSSARAAGFRLEKSSLDRADHNRFLGWAARTYLKLSR